MPTKAELEEELKLAKEKIQELEESSGEDDLVAIKIPKRDEQMFFLGSSVRCGWTGRGVACDVEVKLVEATEI